jgi:hypothetical protein
MDDTLALGGEQLNELIFAGRGGLCGRGRTAGFDGHVPLLSVPVSGPGTGIASASQMGYGSAPQLTIYAPVAWEGTWHG